MAAERKSADPAGIATPNPDGPASGEPSAHSPDPGLPSQSGKDGREPMTLVPSRIKWWVMILGGGSFAGVMLVSSGGDTAAMLIAALSAFFAAIGAIMLLPGANSLRLDEKGFQLTHFFRKKNFSWSNVGEFGVRSLGEQYGEVVVFTTVDHRNILEKIDAALIGEKNAYLPDTYGMAAEQLAQLMTSWRNSASDAAN